MSRKKKNTKSDQSQTQPQEHSQPILQTPKQQGKKITGMTKPKCERLFLALYNTQEDLTELSESERMTLGDLAMWAKQPETAASLEGLCLLNDVRAQLLVGRYRTLAAARLFELAKNEEGGESSRKACVDLLKICLVPDLGSSHILDSHKKGVVGDGAPTAALNEAAVRALFATLGKNADVPIISDEYDDSCCTSMHEQHPDNQVEISQDSDTDQGGNVDG